MTLRSYEISMHSSTYLAAKHRRSAKQLCRNAYWNKYIVTDLFNALPGNSSVNMLQRATIEAMSVANVIARY
jgi:hypothetical protein